MDRRDFIKKTMAAAAAAAVVSPASAILGGQGNESLSASTNGRDAADGSNGIAAGKTLRSRQGRGEEGCRRHANHAYPRHQYGLPAAEDTCRRTDISAARRATRIHEFHQIALGKRMTKGLSVLPQSAVSPPFHIIYI